MRVLRRCALGATLLLVIALVLLGRLASGDPTVDLRDALRAAGYEAVDVTVERAAGGASTVVVDYDPRGQPPAAVSVLSTRAAALTWTRARINIAAVSVRPRGGPVLDVSAAQLEPTGAQQADRESYSAIDGRALRVVLLAVVAVLATGVLVACASVAAVLVHRRRRSVTDNQPGGVGEPAG